MRGERGQHALARGVGRRRWKARPSLLGAACLLIGWSLGVEAHAKPSRWDKVRDPKRVEAERLFVAIERSRVPPMELWDEPEMQRLLAERAVRMLSIAHAESLPDPRLKFMLGDALMEAGDEYLQEADRVLREAIEEAPDSPLLSNALFGLAIVSAKLGHREAEQQAYRQLLEVEWDPRTRATVLLNRGDSNLAEGNFANAIADYESAIGTSSSPDIQGLARWGLAVAFERDRDLPRALATARIAQAIQVPHGGGYIGVLDLPGIFFVPAYDEHYYRALGLMAVALVESDPDAAIKGFQDAALLWSMYLADAQRDAPPWLDNAIRHRQRCLDESKRLMDQLAKRGLDEVDPSGVGGQP